MIVILNKEHRKPIVILLVQVHLYLRLSIYLRKVIQKNKDSGHPTSIDYRLLILVASLVWYSHPPPDTC